MSTNTELVSTIHEQLILSLTSIAMTHTKIQWLEYLQMMICQYFNLWFIAIRASPCKCSLLFSAAYCLAIVWCLIVGLHNDALRLLTKAKVHLPSFVCVYLYEPQLWVWCVAVLHWHCSMPWGFTQHTYVIITLCTFSSSIMLRLEQIILWSTLTFLWFQTWFENIIHYFVHSYRTWHVCGEIHLSSKLI